MSEDAHFHPWELGFKQSGLRRITRTLRGSAINAFITLHAFPPCCCPLALSRPGKAGSPEASPSEPLLSARVIQRRVRRRNLAMRPAFPASDYYGASAPPGANSRRRACPSAALAARGEDDTGRFPRSLESRSTGEAPSSTPAASPTATATPQTFTVASWPLITWRPGVTCCRTRSRYTPRPAHIRQI